MHRTWSICSICSGSFPSMDELKKHINQQHRHAVSALQISALIDQSKRPVGSIKPEECPFCDNSWAKTGSGPTTDNEIVVVDVDHFRQHVGRHLQNVALFALPRLAQGHDDARGSCDVSVSADRDFVSERVSHHKAYWCHGWQIVLRRWTTIFALAHCLSLHQARRRGISREREVQIRRKIQELEGVDSRNRIIIEEIQILLKKESICVAHKKKL